MAKRLPKITQSVVAYVQIEGEAIGDSNDKQMIVQYAYGQIEKIDWYLNLLNMGSNKYIVSQSQGELESVKSQLQSAINTIMNRPIPKPGGAIISVNYPKGYEG